MKTLSLSTAIDWLPRIILALSLIHASACVLFIIGYGFGFGGGVLNLFGPSDIFTIGLKDVSLIYVTSALIPAIFKIMRLRSNQPYAEDIASSIDDEEQRVLELQNIERYRKVVRIFGYVFAALVAAFSVAFLTEGRPFGYTLIPVPLLFLFIIWQDKIKSLLGIDWKVFEVVDFILVLSLSSLAFGAFYGSMDRSSNFEYYKNYLRCDHYALMRSVSDKYIAVRSDGTKHIIDDKSKILFTIP